MNLPKTVTDKKCSTSYKKECKTVNEKVCSGYNQYKQPSCHYVPRQECHDVPVEDCHQVPRQECHEEPQQVRNDCNGTMEFTPIKNCIVYNNIYTLFNIEYMSTFLLKADLDVHN